MDHVAVLIWIFLRIPHTVFHNSCTSLHSLPTVCRSSSLSTFSAALVSFLMKAILTTVRWCLTIVLISILLIIIPVGHLYVVFGEISIQVFSLFLNWILILFCYWVSWVPYIFWRLTVCQIYMFKHFLLLHRLFTVDCFLCGAEAF